MRQLCSRSWGDGSASRRGEGLLLLQPPGEGPGEEMSLLLLQVSEQAKTQFIFFPSAHSLPRPWQLLHLSSLSVRVYTSIHMEKICSFESFFISCNTTEQSRAGFVN